MAIKSLLLAAVAGTQLVSAHFGLTYPPWRTNTLDTEDESISQWTYPCAGVPPNITGNNVTDWPLTGGSLKLELHHAWTYVFVNLALGTGDLTNFNYSLTPQFLNATGKGDLCIPHVALPDTLKPTDGTRATIQVVTVGNTGSALYNCADITFREAAKVLDDKECAANPNITYVPVREQTGNASTADSAASNSTGSGSGAGGKNAGSLAGVDKSALVSVVGLTVALVYGLGF